jgi:hypothetical protein
MEDGTFKAIQLKEVGSRDLTFVFRQERNPMPTVGAEMGCIFTLDHLKTTLQPDGSYECEVRFTPGNGIAKVLEGS